MLPRRTTRLLAAAGLAALLLAACGGDDDESAPSTTEAPASTEPSTTAPPETSEPETTEPEVPADPADACTLLTQADATEALGEEAVPGVVQEATECEWSDEAELRTVQLALLDEDPEEWRAARQAGEFEPVEGVGEEAYYGPVFDDLSFLVGDQVYEIDVELRGDGNAEELATELAQLVASRL